MGARKHNLSFVYGIWWAMAQATDLGTCCGPCYQGSPNTTAATCPLDHAIHTIMGGCVVIPCRMGNSNVGCIAVEPLAAWGL